MKRAFHLLMALVMILIVVAGCVNNPINEYTGSRYYNYGVQAEYSGNWKLARQNFQRALVNAQLGNLGTATEASYLYEWSRMSGYLGMYADAENGFNDSLMLIDKAQGGADELKAPVLCEWARLLHDIEQHQKAIPVYEMAISELEKSNIWEDDPIAFADFLDDYAESLHVVGNDVYAEEVSHRVSAIREANKGLTAKFIAKRYKTKPDNASAKAS